MVLVVTYNTPQYESIWSVYRLYREIFYKIYFCVTDLVELKRFANGTTITDEIIDNYFVTFPMESYDLTGESFYMCLPNALNSNISDFRYNFNGNDSAEGTLVISDDLIPLLWNYKVAFPNFDIDLSRNWYLAPSIGLYNVQNGKNCESEKDKVCNGSDISWRSFIRGQDGFRKAFEEFKIEFPEFLDNLFNITGGQFICFSLPVYFSSFENR